MVIQKNKNRNRMYSSKPNCSQSKPGPLQAVTAEGKALYQGPPKQHFSHRDGRPSGSGPKWDWQFQVVFSGGPVEAGRALVYK